MGDCSKKSCQGLQWFQDLDNLLRIPYVRVAQFHKVLGVFAHACSAERGRYCTARACHSSSSTWWIHLVSICGLELVGEVASPSVAQKHLWSCGRKTPHYSPSITNETCHAASPPPPPWTAILTVCVKHGICGAKLHTCLPQCLQHGLW